MINYLCQVLVVRQDLKMKSGKIASQCARKMWNYCWFSGSVLYPEFFKNLFPTITFFISSFYDFFFICSCLYIHLSFADAATGMYAELMQRYFCSDQCPFQRIEIHSSSVFVILYPYILTWSLKMIFNLSLSDFAKWSSYH